MAKFLGRYESNTPEWHALRKGCLGGSQVGAVMGVNPWESPVAVFYKVTGQIPSEITETRNMRLGKLLEEGMFNNFVVEHPDWECEYQPGTFAHDDFDKFRSNPDILVKTPEGNGVVDIKYSSEFWDEVPPHYVAQVRWYMWIHDLDFGMIAGLIGGRWREFRIERDDFYEDVMLDTVQAFWERVEANQRPDWDGADATYQAVRDLYPTVDDSEVELGGLGLSLLEAKNDLDEVTAEWNEIRSRVLDKMRHAKKGLLNGDAICYRQKSSTGSPFLKVKG